MIINDRIRDKKLQYDINREGAKISALSSVKIHKYEYLTSEDILPSNQQQIIFMIRDKKLLIYLMITQKLNLNLFIDQNRMKLKE